MPVPSEKSIFLNALERESPSERDAFLAEACAGDAQLRASVEELLHAHERTDNPLDEPPHELTGQLVNSGKLGVSPAGNVYYSPIAEAPGSVIGPYKLMEQIGEGGFGLVFVAEQQQPVRRRVALKVVKPGMDTRDVIARFEAERQAVALMHHPNIAQVFDAGTTDTGWPYFVMELVRGVPITEFCDQQQTDPRERLKLFITVCNAVQHAHQKGVIHRDVKPSNVLVTLHDGTPVVKVIDFGVAKAIGQRLTEKTIYTRFAAMIGTPLYMSPEQAEMSGLDVDTRSDIYSLGVLLYELLIGLTPFDSQRLQSAGFDELRRIIREEEPPRPSVRLTTLGPALSTVSAKRKIEPSKLPALVRGDLDWIVMKAIEKDRGRRYETASALAADVSRFLHEEPIEARPPSPLYRFRKFARRHKVTITTISFVAVAMIFGTGMSIWQWSRAVAEGDKKESALKDAIRARNEANEARQDVEQFAERLKEANLLITSGRSHADSDRWLAAHADYTRATELQPNYYNVWVERGAFYVRLGLWKRAAADYAKAMDLGAPADGPASWGVPALFAYVGDHGRFQQLCEQIAKRFAESPDELSAIDIRNCVLAPAPVVDPAALAERAEKLLAEAPKPPFGPRPFGERRPPDRPKRSDNDFDRLPGERSPDDEHGLPDELLDSSGRPADSTIAGPVGSAPRPADFPNGPGRFFTRGREMAWLPRGVNLYVAGLAQYRAGHFDEAIDRLRESIADEWPGRPISYPALAMAYHRAGRGNEARDALGSAEQAIEHWTERIVQSPVGAMSPIPWFDWLECLVVYREAKILITGYAATDDPRLRAAEERALAVIQNRDVSAHP
jgi:hypothetical protein